MLFMILSHDGPQGLAGRKATREAHINYLRGLQNLGRLVVAGPRPKAEAATAIESGFHGDLIIAEFPSIAAARSWAQNDPYNVAGVYDRVDVQAFVQMVLA